MADEHGLEAPNPRVGRVAPAEDRSHRAPDRNGAMKPQIATTQHQHAGTFLSADLDTTLSHYHIKLDAKVAGGTMTLREKMAESFSRGLASPEDTRRLVENFFRSDFIPEIGRVDFAQRSRLIQQFLESAFDPGKRVQGNTNRCGEVQIAINYMGINEWLQVSQELAVKGMATIRPTRAFPHRSTFTISLPRNWRPAGEVFGSQGQYEDISLDDDLVTSALVNKASEAQGRTPEEREQIAARIERDGTYACESRYLVELFTGGSQSIAYSLPAAILAYVRAQNGVQTYTGTKWLPEELLDNPDFIQHRNHIVTMKGVVGSRMALTDGWGSPMNGHTFAHEGLDSRAQFLSTTGAGGVQSGVESILASQLRNTNFVIFDGSITEVRLTEPLLREMGLSLKDVQENVALMQDEFKKINMPCNVRLVGQMLYFNVDENVADLTQVITDKQNPFYIGLTNTLMDLTRKQLSPSSDANANPETVARNIKPAANRDAQQDAETTTASQKVEARHKEEREDEVRRRFISKATTNEDEEFIDPTGITPDPELPPGVHLAKEWRRLVREGQLPSARFDPNAPALRLQTVRLPKLA